MEVTIHPMADYVAAVPRIASWFFEQWRSVYGEESQASVERRIRTWLTRGRIPTALVAVCENQVVGTVALKRRELAGLDYGPWLAGLFVAPEFRQRGIGVLLVGAGEREASTLGVEQLYLYTPSSEGFYERLGWTVSERLALPSGAVALMCKSLRGPNSALLTDTCTSPLRAQRGAAKRGR